MTNNMREQVTEWLTGSDTCFLIGAGCSVFDSSGTTSP